MTTSTLKDKRAPRRNRLPNQRPLWRVMWDYRYIYLLALPGMLFFWVFRYAPMYGIQLAFKEFMPKMGITGSPWVGLEKFIYVFKEVEFWNAVRNTLIIAFMQIGLMFPFPIVLSLLLNEVYSRGFKRTLQTIYTFPHFLSWVILGGILFNLLGEGGAINNILVALGGEKVSFFMDKGIFRWLLLFSLMWKESGWSCILYLATIATIDPALYEAAIVEGANRWHRVRYVTWPGMRGIVVVTLIMRLGSIMDAGYMQVLTLYNPAVYSVGDIIDTYIYRITFQKAPDYGVSTAVGIFKGVTNAILMLSANFISDRLTGEGVM